MRTWSGCLLTALSWGSICSTGNKQQYHSSRPTGKEDKNPSHSIITNRFLLQKSHGKTGRLPTNSKLHKLPTNFFSHLLLAYQYLSGSRLSSLSNPSVQTHQFLAFPHMKDEGEKELLLISLPYSLLPVHSSQSWHITQSGTGIATVSLYFLQYTILLTQWRNKSEEHRLKICLLLTHRTKWILFWRWALFHKKLYRPWSYRATGSAVTGQGAMNSNLQRVVRLPRDVVEAPYPGRHPRSGWTRLWTTWCGCKCPCLLARLDDLQRTLLTLRILWFSVHWNHTALLKEVFFLVHTQNHYFVAGICSIFSKNWRF